MVVVERLAVDGVLGVVHPDLTDGRQFEKTFRDDCRIVAGESGAMYSFKNEGEMDHLRPIRNAWER